MEKDYDKITMGELVDNFIKLPIGLLGRVLDLVVFLCAGIFAMCVAIFSHDVSWMTVFILGAAFSFAELTLYELQSIRIAVKVLAEQTTKADVEKKIGL